MLERKIYKMLKHRAALAERFERTIRMYLADRPLLHRRIVQDYLDQLDDDEWAIFWQLNGERYAEVRKRNEMIELEGEDE